MRALGLALALLLAACGDPADAQREAAGTYRLDKDAMRGPWISAYDNMVDTRFETLPNEQLRERERPKADAAKAKFRTQFEQLDVTLALEADGTWALSGQSLEGAIDRGGTWSLHDHVLTFVSAGAATPGRYDAGAIRMRPEPNLPEQMLFRRE